MKKGKILIFTIVLMLLFTQLAFSAVTEIPLKVYNKALELSPCDKFIITSSADGTFFIYYNTEQLNGSWTIPKSYNSDNSFVNSGSMSPSISFVSTTNSGDTFSNVTVQGSPTRNGNIVYSTDDVVRYGGDGGVFFSKQAALPLQEKPLERALQLFVQNVVSQSSVILVVAVAILALMVVVSLIPRVLYKLL